MFLRTVGGFSRDHDQGYSVKQDPHSPKGEAVIENVDGPIGTSKGLPYGSATAGQSEQARLLKEFDYVEEEFFVSGTANLYGPTSSAPLKVLRATQ